MHSCFHYMYSKYSIDFSHSGLTQTWFDILARASVKLLVESVRFHWLSVIFNCLTVKNHYCFIQWPIAHWFGFKEYFILSLLSRKNFMCKIICKFFPKFTICTIFNMMLCNFPDFLTQLVCKSYCIPQKMLMFLIFYFIPNKLWLIILCTKLQNILHLHI